ncbi:hypothetical protein LTR10_006194 [Elasticomyces elasticus]|nr:hypothetical protein LTR10_006194 [Elasticomyces elasticus]KAK4966756.1 hypothetical protein LTR42_011067 [Elasticomyces elasticus]
MAYDSTPAEQMSTIPAVPSNQAVDYVPATHLNEAFAAKAESLKPTLHEWLDEPIDLVRFVPSKQEFFGYQALHLAAATDLPLMQWGKGDDFVLDFGTHRVGYLHFRLEAEGVNIDAPTRLKLTFGEIPPDVVEDLQPCHTWISTSWIPEEVMTIDWPPQSVTIARRHSFRYLRIQVIDTSPKYRCQFKDLHVRAVSAVSSDIVAPPLKTSDPELIAIDRVAQRTLRDCMHTVFEDGPRRDRRMWLGDLRLQALSSYYTYPAFDLVKRCLYMFAALPREDGSLPATLFEFPTLRPASDYIVDYDALFGPTVYDYVLHSGDVDTGAELWTTILGSMKTALLHITSSGTFDSSATKAWKFCDWVENDPALDVAMQGLVLFCCRRVNDLASLLNKQAPFTELVQRMSNTLCSQVHSNDLTPKLSWTAAAWICLSGALAPPIAKLLLLRVLEDKSSIKPLTPYAWHHVAEALAMVGAERECLEMLKSYWGGMVRAGADTFWECFDPDDPQASPYGDYHNNSYCHAWSCTPSYLLRGVLKDYLVAVEDGA